jgi:hypothetical protein
MDKARRDKARRRKKVGAVVENIVENVDSSGADD